MPTGLRPGEWRGTRLRSARQPLCTNCQRAGPSLEEVSALMGHAVDRTSSEHDRRASGGWEGVPLIRPDPANIALVRTTARLRPRPTVSKR